MHIEIGGEGALRPTLSDPEGYDEWLESVFENVVTVCRPLANWKKIQKQDKDFWYGKCATCTRECSVPFQPFSGYPPPVCRGCLLERKKTSTVCAK
jgi:hypothetical protein